MMEQSLTKTLAHKHKTSVAKIYDRYRSEIEVEGKQQKAPPSHRATRGKATTGSNLGRDSAQMESPGKPRRPTQAELGTADLNSKNDSWRKCVKSVGRPA